MQPPTQYSEWSVCLEELERGGNDETTLTAMAAGTLNWGAGVAPLFAERICRLFDVRLKRCIDSINRDLKSAREEALFLRILLDARRAFTFLSNVAVLPSFPENLRDQLSILVRKSAEVAQKSLEDSSKHDRSGRLGSLIRNNSLLNYNANGNAASNQSLPNPRSNDGTRRRNILQ